MEYQPKSNEKIHTLFTLYFNVFKRLKKPVNVALLIRFHKNVRTFFTIWTCHFTHLFYVVSLSNMLNYYFIKRQLLFKKNILDINGPFIIGFLICHFKKWMIWAGTWYFLLIGKKTYFKNIASLATLLGFRKTFCG